MTSEATRNRGSRYRDEIDKIEQCGIDCIPEVERRSSPRNLVTILAGGSLSFLAAGAVAALSYPLVLALFPEPAEVYGPIGHDVKGHAR
jgi:hypothetical protein